MTEQIGGDAPQPVGTTVVVDRVVPKSVKETWKLLVTPQGNEALLGKGGVIGDKGDSWESEEGTFGVIRSYHPLEQIRFYWHAAQDAPKTVVEVNLTPQGDETLLEIKHDRVPAYFDTAKLENRWNTAIDKVLAQ
ncbi:MAG: SRPBCC domain-containing protein [Propionibacteriaceae bacterium]|nr:SRPBCC domain-containing protein [Propionibacteriaceae bacterium]